MIWGDVIVGVVVGALSKAAGGDESAFSIGSRLFKPRANYNVRERSNVEETASARATYLGRVQAARHSDDEEWLGAVMVTEAGGGGGPLEV